ncbi:neurogenic locus notch homolog protein 1-like isoform X2 [Patiria miniata]|uniref:EGF-like domain-containing protein n=1 Tax=Patiria miniata TaxID=46514 RepID=A0A913ZYH3_PATMI|nr:neurogenic locus notch homolog protein 1-like isoform X2 [Patiria miniata]
MNMNLLAVLSTGFVVIVLSKYAEAVLWPTIHREGRTGSCNVGTTCADGFYCAGGECLKCSPCPDLNTYHKNQLTVFRDCLRQGLCPHVCSQMYLPLHQQANQSFCFHLRSSQGCNIRSCDNEGTLDMQACRCLCSTNRNGTDCSECGLSCLNGGTLDDSDCQCRCDKDWTGMNCSECGLSCLNGGTLDVPDCQCKCDKDWTGRDCSNCGLKFCLNGGTLNPTACQCSCSEGWSGHNCSEPQTEGGNPPTQTNVDGK